MAHFAQLDENNVVVQVIVINNNELLDENGNESEAKGIVFCQSLLGEDTRWVQTSYNKKFRKHYAGIGFTYRNDIDAFVPIKKFSSWVFNEQSVIWEPPVPYPVAEPYAYIWDEPTLSWIAAPSKFETKQNAELG